MLCESQSLFVKICEQKVTSQDSEMFYAVVVTVMSVRFGSVRAVGY